MASSDWLEVQRLAAEFQRTQLTSSLQKLSERNCVEIVTKLIDLKLIELFYTNDGKEYVTPQQLSREIRDELYLHGGKISLFELVQLLNISMQTIEARAQDVARSNPDVHLVAPHLIDNSYLDHITEEINESLQQNGTISLIDLTKQYDLPIDFLLKQLLKRVGSILQGQQDKHDQYVFFTEGFLARNKARIRGALSAVTVPTSASTIIAQNKFPERLFFAIADELIAAKRIEGTLNGGRQANAATFIPDVYSRKQNEWIDNFFAQNGYLEYDALTRLGIANPKEYCRKRFKDTQLLFLSSCCVGRTISDQVEAAIEEALSSNSWVDIMPLLPSVFDESDGEHIIQEVLKSSQELPVKNALVLGRTTVASQSLIPNLRTIFDPMVEEKAKEVVASGAYLQAQADQRNAKLKSAKSEAVGEKKDRKEERRKKASEGKVGGGVQGRETKTKSTKKKFLRGKNDSDSDGEEDNAGSTSAAFELEFLSLDEIGQILRKSEGLAEASDEFIAEIADRLHKQLKSSFQEAARLAFEALLAASSGQRRQTHGELQDKISNLLQNMKQGEKAISHFASLDVQDQLTRHLLKTSGSELINELVLYVGQDVNISSDSKNLSPEVRLKLIGELPQNMRPSLQALHKSTTGASIEEFFTQADVALAACDIVLRKVDKKKEKTVGSAQRYLLIDQLNAATEAALVLHLASLLLFHSVTQTVLNASGRFVPQIITFLQHHLPTGTAELLTNMQALVIQELTSKGDEEVLASVRSQMDDLMPRLREAAVTFKKSNSAGQE